MAILGRNINLVDFSVYKPPESLKIIVDEIRKTGKAWSTVTEEAERFMLKIFIRSGISDKGTYLPPSIHPNHTKDADTSLDAGEAEARMVMLGAVGDLLKKTGIRGDQVDIVVTCCSIYCPTPSLSSMIVNHFGMRHDVQAYSLGGMGCGTGVIGINLVSDMLKARPNSIAIFVPAEITSYCYYPGSETNRMVSNVIFRMGGAAIMLSDRADLAKQARFQLEHKARVHTAANDGAYACMSWGPDKEGINGVYLGKDVVQHAASALNACLRQITPRLLTWRQTAEAGCVAAKSYLSYFSSWLSGRKSGNTDGAEAPVGLQAYKPDFTQCADHFAIHAGGYAVLKGVQQGMGLPASHMLPSFAALRDYGNTSCSTTWHILAYLETMGFIKEGERVLQIGMGGGMKVGINSWRALRDIHNPHPAWAHLQGEPLTEDALPRGIEAVTGDAQAPRPPQQQPERSPAGAAAEAPPAKAGVALTATSGAASAKACTPCGSQSMQAPRGGVEYDEHGHPVEHEAL